MAQTALCDICESRTHEQIMLLFQHPPVTSLMSAQGTLHVFTFCPPALLTPETPSEICMSGATFFLDFCEFTESVLDCDFKFA